MSRSAFVGPVPMHVLALSLDLRFPEARSLKAKRALLRPVTDGIAHRFPVAVSEVAHQDVWQRSELGIAAVSGSARQVAEIIDDVERFVWTCAGVEVLSAERSWMEIDR